MSLNLEKLSKIISQTKLSLTDQNDLLLFLPVLPETSLSELIDLFEKNPKLVKEFNDNFRARLKALADGQDAWDDLISQEEKMSEEIDKEETEEEQ